MDTPITRYEALVRCRDAAGSDSQLARDLGAAQATVWRWINQTRQMPAEYVLTAERLYGVPCHHLRPDIYPRDLMIDQAAEERFCGIDLRRADRREAPHRKVA